MKSVAIKQITIKNVDWNAFITKVSRLLIFFLTIAMMALMFLGNCSLSVDARHITLAGQEQYITDEISVNRQIEMWPETLNVLVVMESVVHYNGQVISIMNERECAVLVQDKAQSFYIEMNNGTISLVPSTSYGPCD